MTFTTSNALAGLAGQLTDPQDRERYAAIVLYMQALPPEDEFRHLAELLGLLSLMSQRLPDALAEFLAELRTQTKATADYHGQVEARLANLPSEIATGVDPAAIAEEMSEAFRQELSRTGLRDATSLLAGSAKDIRALSEEIAAALKPAAQEYRNIASTISGEAAKLVTAARQVEQHNERLIQRQREDGWIMKTLVGLILFLVGGVCGMLYK